MPDRGAYGSLDQFERDFVLHVTAERFNLSQLHWVFPELPETLKGHVVKNFVTRIKESTTVREALKRAEVNQGLAEARLDEAIRGGLFGFKP